MAGDGGFANLENFSIRPISIKSVRHGSATGLISGTPATCHFTLVVAPTNQTTVDANLAKLHGRHATGNVVPHPHFVAMKSERSRNEPWRNENPAFTV